MLFETNVGHPTEFHVKQERIPFVFETTARTDHLMAARREATWYQVGRNFFQSDKGDTHICNDECNSWIFMTGNDGVTRRQCAISGRFKGEKQFATGGRLMGEMNRPIITPTITNFRKRKADSQNCFYRTDNDEDYRDSWQQFKRKYEAKPTLAFTNEGFRTNYKESCFDEPTYGAGSCNIREGDNMEI